MTEPLVSVGFPTYNNPEGFRKALDTILGQTYKNLEVIISVNPSENGSVNLKYHLLFEEYRHRDARVKWNTNLQNIGAPNNYWVVLHSATGKYFMFAQDDDSWSDKFIERLVVLLEACPSVPLAMSFVHRKDEHGIFDAYDMEGIFVTDAMRDDRLSFLWMGLWRRDKILDYATVWSDIAMSAQALLDGEVLIDSSVVYTKGLKHSKAKEQIRQDPFWFFMIYYHLLRGVARKNIGVLPLVAITNLVWVCKSYVAQVLFLLPVDHPIRKFVRRI